jgi:ribonuclease P protein component
MLKRENRLAKIIRRVGEEKFFSPLFNIRISDNKDGKVRFGFVVSKKIDKRAVVRNRTKRVLQSVADSFINKLTNKDVVVVAKKGLSFKDKEAIREEFTNILKKVLKK